MIGRALLGAQRVERVGGRRVVEIDEQRIGVALGGRDAFGERVLGRDQIGERCVQRAMIADER